MPQEASWCTLPMVAKRKDLMGTLKRNFSLLDLETKFIFAKMSFGTNISC